MTHLPYLAGFFDGEGCVCYSRSPGRKGSRKFRRLHVSAGQADNVAPLKLLQRNFGGTISSRPLKSGKTFFEWRVSSYRGVMKVFVALRPYMMVKGEQFLQKLQQYHAN